MKKPKVTVVGAGFVGATAARRLVEKEIANVVLIDIADGLAQGKALDIMQSAYVEGFKTRITGTNDYKDTKNSDVVVITAGLARKPGMSRDDLLFKNTEIVSGIAQKIAEFSPEAILVIVTNPLDVMTYVAWKKSGFNASRVIGMAGELDSARYAYFFSEELHCSPKEVKAMVLGGHGDQMVPVPEQTKVRGKAITELLDKETIERINQRTRDGGAEIVKFLKSGSAFYAPSSAAVKMVQTILEDKGEIIPSCVKMTGQYGLEDVFCGVPVKLGCFGVREIIEISLTDEERQALQKSANQVRESCEKLKL